MTRRARHFLACKAALDALAVNHKLPSSRSIAVAAGITPSTARRWLADLRQIIDKRASHYQEAKPPSRNVTHEKAPTVSSGRGFNPKNPSEVNQTV